MDRAQRFSNETIRPSVLSKVLFFADLIVIVSAGRLSLSLTPVAELAPGFLSMLVWLGGLTAVVSMRLWGSYRFRRMRAFWHSLLLGIVGMMTGLAALDLLLIISGADTSIFEPFLLTWAVLSIGLLVLLRLAADIRLRWLMRSGQLEHRIVLVGGGPTIAPLIREIERERGRGRRLVGFFDERKDRRSPSVIEGYHKMGDVDDLVAFARLARIDTVVIAIPRARQRRIDELLQRLFVLPVDIRVIEGAEVPQYSRARRSKIGPYKLIEIYKRPLTGGDALKKRAFDLAVASCALVLLAPVMLGVAVAIKLDSPGPILFRQRRHGFNNRPITVLKFRSMYSDKCDPTAINQVRAEDPRVTRVGRFIRRTSLDELPQFWNVLKGDLSVVGPRPHAISARTGDIEYHDIAAAYSARHKVKPGITGWAQINGWRGELNSNAKIETRIAHDLYYIEHWSVWFDLRIMLMTPWSMAVTKNAY